MNQRIRIEDGERKSIDRVRTAISFVLHVAEGMSIDDAKACSGLRGDLPPFIQERLAKLTAARALASRKGFTKRAADFRAIAGRRHWRASLT
jgi:hypothetical protein